MTAFVLTLLGFGGLGIVCYVCYHAGKSDERAMSFQNMLETDVSAGRIRDRLRRDPRYAERLRERFTR